MSFFQNGKNLGVAFREVPTNGALVPIFGMKSKNDSLILLPCFSSISSVPGPVLVDNHALSLSTLRSLADLQDSTPFGVNFMDFAYKEYQSWVLRERKRHTIRTGQKMFSRSEFESSATDPFWKNPHNNIYLQKIVHDCNRKAEVYNIDPAL